MEEGVVGAAVGVTIQVVLQNLISFSMKEIKLIRDFKKDLQKLRSTLITIREFIDDAETLQLTNKPVKRWLKKLEDVAFQAYYVLDELDYLSLRKDRHKMEAKETAFKEKIRSVASNFHDRRKLSHKIMDINKDFESICKEASVLGLQARLVVLQAAGVSSHASAGEETDSFTCDPVFLGRENDVKEIVEKITNIQPDQVFSILPIVGMGGMGKSTLARQVLKVQTHFDTHIWVHVSPHFDPNIILKKILMILTSEDVNVESREVVLKKLKEALTKKTYLLVLDDVWNEEGLMWEGFINSLSGITSTKGNGIIVTTRKGNVASVVATLPIHELRGLPEDSCWSIIKAKAFGGDIIPSEFETLGKKIAERCRGLPLAANVVGGVLRGKSKDEWIWIQKNWLSDHIEGDFIKKALKLSFDNLPSPSLKKCFAYCSIFPKGALIEKADLIELWMGEGFLEADQRSDMETIGNKLFNRLLHDSLLHIVNRDHHNNAILCSMHDLVHDVAMKVNDNISDGIYRARYSGHEFYGDESKEKANSEFVRTLFFGGGSVSGAMFSYFRSLHNLTLMGHDVTELPSTIRELIHLRYLNISKTSIKDLPDEIGELYHLQTLRTQSISLTKLPCTLKYLIGLRHFYVYYRTELPGELGKLTSLQTIPFFRVGEDKGHQIVELGSLVNLKGGLKIYNLEKVRGKEEAKSACIFQKPNIIELLLQWNEFREGETNYMDVLEGLQPHPNLKILEIDGFNGSRFPAWTLKMGVQEGLMNLMKIRLSRCSKCEEIPMMGHLPHLKSLLLRDMWNVKCIDSSFYGIDHSISNNSGFTVTAFPALEQLVIQNMPKMREWVEAKLDHVMAFPCLEYLEISNCKELRSAPCHFPCRGRSRSFTSFVVGEFEDLMDWFKQKLHISPDYSSGNLSLRSLVIQDCHELMNLPCEMVKSCATSLEWLELRGMRRVMNMQMIVDCLHKMSRLTNMALTSIPEFIITSTTGTPICRSLLQLSIRPDSNSWDCASFKKAVDGILTRFESNSLRQLELSGKQDWESLPDQLQYLFAVESLDLSDFGIQELPEWFGNLPSLQELRISNCRRLRSLPSVEAMRRLTNLIRLYISDCRLLTERGIRQKSNGDDSEWPKISHIPCIEVDGHMLERG